MQGASAGFKKLSRWQALHEHCLKYSHCWQPHFSEAAMELLASVVLVGCARKACATAEHETAAN